jgi:hypothetical protein
VPDAAGAASTPSSGGNVAVPVSDRSAESAAAEQDAGSETDADAVVRPATAPSVPHANGHGARPAGAARPRPFADLLSPPRRAFRSAAGPAGRTDKADQPDQAEQADQADLADTGELFAELGPDGLPRRVRQANLAPQLRRDPGAAADTPAQPAAPAGPRPPRSPEQNRATMSAFQRGFTLGRAEEPTGPRPGQPAQPGQPGQSAQSAAPPAPTGRAPGAATAATTGPTGVPRPADHDDRGETR